MKLLIVFAALFTASAHAGDIEHLQCASGEFAHEGTVRATLDSGTFTPGSGYKDMNEVSVYYQFSGVNKMVCAGNIKNYDIDVDCVGFYSARDVTTVKFRTENGKIMAHWRTSKPYGRKAMDSECVIEP